MTKKTFLLLGGYGNVGRWLAELLLQETKVHLVLAGRAGDQAQKLADTLNQKFTTQRVTAKSLDAANFESLQRAFQGVDLVIVASSTLDYVNNVARAALEARIDYLDTQLSSPEKFHILESLRKDIEQAGCCFITDAGFHPGLPAALINYAARQFDRLEQAQVASLLQVNWQVLTFSEATWIEFLKELKNYQSLVWQGKQWLKPSWWSTKKFDFGAPFGPRDCVPMFLEELRILPNSLPSLTEMGFYIAGFHWLSDYIFMPLSFLILSVAPKAIKPVGKLYWWSLKTFSKPPFGTMLLLEASGWQGEQRATLRMTLFHEDAYVLTAASVVAGLLQYLEVRKPGLWWQANLVEPQRLLKDLERMGIQTRQTCI